MSTYIKIQDTWTPIKRIFKKINGEWVQQNDIISALGDMIYIYGGHTISILLSILGEEEYLGQSFILSSTYDNSIVYPEWSIVAGNAYATINSNGKVTILSGANENTITVQASYDGYTETKDIVVTYDGHQLSIESASTITGTSGNVIARYDGTIVTPTWSIISGGTNATIDSSGNITIISSGDITVQASYNDYTTTKNITLVYDAGTTTETEVNDDGSTTTTVTIVTENQDGSTTETSVVTIVDENGNTSNTESETITNQDGSSTTSSTTTNSDGSSSETTSTTSAPDENGTVVTESSTSTTNADGTTSETTATLTENEDGSSESSYTTLNYDENGDLAGSTENETTNNADGSSSSTTTNFDENGDATSQINEDTDTSGNINTQDIEYENGEPIVTGYTIDTSNNEDGTKNYNGDGVDTEFYGFDATRGFVVNFHFTIDFTKQPANQNENHHNILTMKRANPQPWYGFQIRQSSTNKYVQLGTQFETGSNTNTTINPRWITTNVLGEYDLTITYDPSKSTNSFICYNNLTNSNVYTSNLKFPDIDALRYLTVCIGCAQDPDGNTYRYSAIDVLNFNIIKLNS